MNEHNTPHEQADPVKPGDAIGAASQIQTDPVGSLLDGATAERDSRVEHADALQLPLPYWGRKMWAVYGVPSVHDYDKFVAKIGPKTKPSLDQSLDVILTGCRGIYLVEDPDAVGDEILTEDGEPKDGVHLVADRYGNDLRRRLGDRVPEKGRARDLVLYMIGGNPMAVAAHAADILEWMQAGSSEVEHEIVGESDRS